MIKKLILFIIISINTLNAEQLHIHIISGAKEYEAKKSMELYTKELINVFKAKVTHTATVDKSKKMPNIEELKDADLLIIFSRRLMVQKKDLKIIQDFLNSEKPVIGIRTASHAFQTLLELDKKYFGGSYSGHDKGTQTQMKINEKCKDHPILKGISFDSWERFDKPYYNYENAKDTQLLLTGHANKKSHAMAWTRTLKKQRIFYTSLGLPKDFQDKRFLHLLNNAVKWATAEMATDK